MDQEQSQKAYFATKIKQSDLVFGLKSIAQTIFSQWLIVAEQVYAMPTQWADNIRNDDVTPIFIEQMAMAFESLVDEEYSKNRLVSGWSYGFVCGHIKGGLNTTWVNQYIIEQSKGYRDLFKLLSLRSFICRDKTSLEKVFGFYQYFLAEYSVDTVLDAEPGDNVVALSDHNKAAEVRLNQFGGELDELLKDLFISRYMGFFETTKESCCPDIDQHFSQAQLLPIAGEAYFN